MIATRITPGFLAVGLASQMLLSTGLDLFARLGWTPRFPVLGAVVIAAGGVFAYGAALLLNLEVAAEYRSVRWLHIAWLALAANAGFSLLRPVINSSALDLLVDDYTAGPVHGLLNHLLVVPANTFLLLGVLAMWWSYHRVGLGFKIERRDYVVMIGFLILMIAILVFREGLTEARSIYPVSSYLQVIGLVLISVVAAASIVLHRLAIQMGGGRLALALRWLTVYVILRNVLVLANTLRQVVGPEPGPEFVLVNQFLVQFTQIFWPVVPWTAALAAAHHAQLTAHAAETLKRRRVAKAALASA